jgi:DNA-binding GntR family transcriptional regulator
MKRTAHAERVDDSAAGRTAGERKAAGALGRDISADIEVQIVEGRLSPGDKLDEVALGQRYGVSRTPVREALRALAATGLVHFQPRIGAIVAQPTVGEVMDLFEVVAEMEGVAARLACERMDEMDEALIVDTHRACQKAASSFDAEQYYRTNGQFHRAIQKAAHNQVLIDQIELMNKRLSPYRRFITLRPGRTETAIQEHEGVFNAVLERNGEAASSAMRRHVRVLAEDTLALSRSLRL